MMVSAEMTTSPTQRLRAQQFARNLARARKNADISQSELARLIWGEVIDSRGYKVAKNRDLISSYERGRYTPSRETLEQLARVLKVEPETLDPTSAQDNFDKANPAIAMTMVEGQPDKVILQINLTKKTTLAHASKIIAMLSEETEEVANDN